MRRPVFATVVSRPSTLVGMLVSAALLTVAVADTAGAQCVGDCDNNCTVTINELINGVRITLGSQAVDTCAALDANGSESVAINELISAVSRALEGCGTDCVGGSPSPTPTSTPVVSGTQTTPATETPGTPGSPTVTRTPTLTTPGTPPGSPTVTRTPTLTTPGTPTGTPTVTRTPTRFPPTPAAGLSLVGARAADGTTVRVTFNGVIQAGSGLNPRNYEIVQTDNPNAGGPEIIAVRFVLLCDGGTNDGQTCNDTAETAFTDGAAACPGGSCSIPDHQAVVLSTSAHAGLQYRIRVTGVRDTAGTANIVFGPLGDRRNEQLYAGRPPERLKHCAAATAAATVETGRCLPLRCTTNAECPGGGACVDVIPDCDGDGLTDDVEAAGWDVTVTGSAPLRVTSNPLRVDTDGDGLPDNQELRSSSIGSVSNPRNKDTDGDELDDYREVVLLRISPTNSDHDADGLTDGVEYNEGYSPRDADSDGDSIIDASDFGAGGGDPRLADLPAFDIQVGNAQVRLNYEFALKQNNMVIDTTTASQSATMSDTSSTSRTETDTTMMEWYAKASVKVEASAGYPDGFGAKVSVTAEAGVGAAGKNEVTATTAKETVDAYNRSKDSGRMLTAGQTEERTVTGATVSADVRFINTGPLSMSLDDILVRMRMADPLNPGEFITIGALDPVGLSAPIELGTLTTMREVPFTKSLDGRGPEFVEALMRNPRSIIFDVSNFRLKSPPSDPNSYVEKEASIVANTAEVTVDFAGEDELPVQRFFVSSNLGRQEAVRDRNSDGEIDAADAERVIYLPPDGEYLYPRLTEALTIRGYDFTVNEDGQFTSIGGIANDLEQRKAWIVVVTDDTGTVTMTPLATFDPAVRVDEIYMKPGLQVWVSYMQDFDADLVPRSAESLFGSSDADPDSDDDGVGDYAEIFESAPVTVTNETGQSSTFQARSNPILADTDGDGLSDLRERDELHTASDVADTDGDGVDDKDEVDVDDSDPLDARDYRCRPHLFRFVITSVPDNGDFEGDVYFPFGHDTQQTEEKCSLTIQRGGQTADSSGIHFGGGFAVTQVTGFASCQLSSCQVDSCQTTGAGDIGGYCHTDPGRGVHPHCTNGIPLGRPTQVSASYFVQCN